MVYVDSSVFLAALLAEQRRPLPEFWDRRDEFRHHFLAVEHQHRLP